MESELFKVMRTVPAFWWRNTVVRPYPHWKVRLPPRADELWNHSHHRRAWVRRIFKKFEADHAGKVKYRFFSESAEVDTMCHDAEQVASKSYQRGLKTGFIYNDACCQRLRLYAKLGILRACILYVDGVPCSFWIGSIYKQRFYSAYLAHDPRFAKYECGSLVFLRVLEKLCAEHVSQVDLGQGEGFYKERFGDQCDLEACLHVFSPSLRNLALNAGFGVGEALAMGAKKTLFALNVLQAARIKWRRHLAKKAADAQAAAAL
jgi:hypothetical protein